MVNELRSQIGTGKGIPLPEAILRDASTFPIVVLNPELKPMLPVCLYQNPNNGLQLPVSIGASQLSDQTYGMNVRANVRVEGNLVFYTNAGVAFAGAGTKTITLTVPAGKLWVIRIASIYLSGTATTSWCNFQIVAPTGVDVMVKQILTPVIGTAYGLENYWIGGTLTLPSGWSFRFSQNVSADTSGVYTNKLVYEEITV